jgi:uncharacterized membrane protein
MTLVSGAALGAGAMYLLDPDRGERRRARLRDALAELGESEVVERARELEPVELVRRVGGEAVRRLGGEAARQLGGETVRQLGGTVGAALAASRWGGAPSRGWRRRAAAAPGRDWIVLAGLTGAIVAGLWLARRARAGAGGVEVVRTMTVDAPVERVYEFWNDFENFPRFMSHVREVRRVGPDRTHWVVAGPGGAPIEWDAIVTRRVPHEEISWRTVEGSLVEHRGTVRFVRLGPSTQIEVRTTYRPVGGPLGHGLAALFGHDPERLIGDDLARGAEQLQGPRPAVGESGQRR